MVVGVQVWQGMAGLRFVLSDSDVMDKILYMTQWSDEAYNKADAAGLKVALLQCVDTHTGRKYTKMQAVDPEQERACQAETSKEHPAATAARNEGKLFLRVRAGCNIVQVAAPPKRQKFGFNVGANAASMSEHPGASSSMSFSPKANSCKSGCCLLFFAPWEFPHAVRVRSLLLWWAGERGGKLTGRLKLSSWHSAFLDVTYIGVPGAGGVGGLPVLPVPPVEWGGRPSRRCRARFD